MIPIILCGFVMIAVATGNVYATNLAHFLCILTCPAGFANFGIIVFIAYNEQWGKRPKPITFKRRFIRALNFATIVVLAACGWYWSAIGWAWWWFSIEVFGCAIREHWKEILE